jgi:hypothetical protein
VNKFKVFKRAWWRKDANGRIVPNPGARKTTLRTGLTESEARAFCARFNAENPVDWRSVKAEFTVDA